MKYVLVAVGLSCAALASHAATAKRGVGPVPLSEAISTHAPFEMRACEACHEDGQRLGAPGRVLKVGDALCFDCHDEFKQPVKGHPGAAEGACLDCHSPHNARKKKLLL